MNDKVKKYPSSKSPFNATAVIWFQAWRDAIRKAKKATTPEDRKCHCYRAAIAQAQYITAVISSY